MVKTNDTLETIQTQIQELLHSSTRLEKDTISPQKMEELDKTSQDRLLRKIAEKLGKQKEDLIQRMKTEVPNAFIPTLTSEIFKCAQQTQNQLSNLIATKMEGISSTLPETQSTS